MFLFMVMEKRAAALKQLPKSQHYFFFSVPQLRNVAPKLSAQRFCKVIPAGCGRGKLSA